LLAEKAANEVVQREMQQCKQRERENLMFRLADESFPSSECNYDEPDEIRSTSLHLGNEINDFKRSHPVNDISCGHQIGNEVVLRSFQDPVCSEPRGKVNLHIVGVSDNGDCRAGQESLVNEQKVVVCIVVVIFKQFNFNGCLEFETI
jgi:hypothetical protein